MTDRQRHALLLEARRRLARTGQGHIQWVKGGKVGGHWKEAEKLLNQLQADLKPVPVPALGPMFSIGKSVLMHDLTHKTSGIPLYPAFDDAYDEGLEIIAPEALTVIGPATSSNPGHAFYARGASLIRYWFGHLDRTQAIGRKFAKGDKIGRVGPNAIGGGPHVHVGINVELLLGKGRQLLHHTDYTHGAPKIGVQLERALT